MKNDEPTVVEIVRFYDPEIVAHNDSTICGRYSVERDLEILSIPDDAKPIRFRCRLLSRDQRRAVSEIGSDARRYDLAFRYGVLEIYNLPDANGGVRGPWLHNRSKPRQPLDDTWLDATGLGDADVAEIGSAIWGLSFLATGVPPRCEQLDSSLRAFGAAERLCVERKKDSQTGRDE